MKSQEPASEIVVLLDDCESSPDKPGSRLLTNPVGQWRVVKQSEISAVLNELDVARREGLHVAALFSYELGEYLQGLQPRPSHTPLIEAFAFKDCALLSAAEVSDWINAELSKASNGDQPAGLLDIESSIDQSRYTQDIAAIQELIAQGDTYQVNHTFRLKGSAFGNPLALYRNLRKRQPVRFGAYIDTSKRRILSFSPELFIRNDAGVITAKPMKGTLSAGQGSAKDLKENAKDRAENLMITDLIRNDLGRVCETGSIAVPDLFEVEQVGGVYQMTSTVTGRLRSDVGLSELLCATFPCGSVTGAPKKRTMEIIQSLEGSPRELYCGSIGYFDPSGDFQMNVVIRTLELDEKNRFEMGVGSGITIDSDPAQEWQECMIKAGFVTSMPSPVGLIETMRCENGRLPLMAAHLDRMQASAQSLRIAFDMEAIEQQIRTYLSQTKITTVFAVRLELQPSGKLQITDRAIEQISSVQKVFWAKDLIGNAASVMSSKDPLLRHKTTARKAYDNAWQAAVASGGFDALFTNERGEVTEGGRSSIFALIDETWKTPALACGVLPGVMRAKILSDPQWNAEEAILFPDDIRNAKRLVAVNALRGVIEVDGL